MNIIFLLIPLSLVLLAVATAAFFWAMKHDQFDDLEGPAYSIFNEEDRPSNRKRKSPPSEPADASERT